MLKAEDLTVVRSGRSIIKGLTFQVEKGDLLVVIEAMKMGLHVPWRRDQDVTERYYATSAFI